MTACRPILGLLPLPVRGAALVFAAAFPALFTAFAMMGKAADPAPDDPPVTFSLDQAAARAGEKISLTFSLETKVSLRSISVSMDFDESRMRVVSVHRAQNAMVGAEPVPPDDVASTSINNADQVEGNQVREGWIHLDLNIEGEKAELPLEKGLPVPVLVIEFLVLPEARPGFAPVVFETVGPVDALPAAFLVNRVVITGLADIAQDLTPAAMKDGGIDIIGEVGFFMRGDANFDRRRDISDPIASLAYLFLGGQQLPCLESGDANDDGRVDISDPIFTLGRLFEGGGSFPEPSVWGPDPTPDRLGCAAYPGQ